jgi:VanZ family protein
VKPETRNFLAYQLPAILWTALVLFASSDAFSGAQTGRLLEAILGALFAELPRGVLMVAHLAIRKLAHLTEYAILAWLLYRTRGDTPGVWNFHWAKVVMAGVLVVAAIDEVHQHFVPSRVGSPVDVMIDLAGAVVALLILRRRAKIDARDTSAVASQ